jgi:hypothetical protein
VSEGPSPRQQSRHALLRQARRGVLRSRVRDDAVTPLEEPLAALACGDCGRLAWTVEPGGSPHRRETAADPRTTSGACAHCGATSWLRVGNASTAATLQAAELDQRNWPKRIVSRALVGTAAGAGLGLLTLTGWPILLVAGLTGLAAGLVSYRDHRKWSPPRAALPGRWMMALPPASPARDTVCGRLVVDELLCAPLTGRTCVAYEVGIHVDDRPGSELERWALVEQRIAAATIGEGTVIDPSRTHLEIARERIGTVAEVSRDEAARAYLQPRGFGRESDGLHVFESIVPADAEVFLERGDDGDRLRSSDRAPVTS